MKQILFNIVLKKMKKRPERAKNCSKGQSCKLFLFYFLVIFEGSSPPLTPPADTTHRRSVFRLTLHFVFQSFSIPAGSWTDFLTLVLLPIEFAADTTAVASRLRDDVGRRCQRTTLTTFENGLTSTMLIVTTMLTTLDHCCLKK